MVDNTLVAASAIIAMVFAVLVAAAANLVRLTRRKPRATKTPEWLDLDFRTKCKRKAPEGSNAVPCLLCAGPCWGDMLDEANQRTEEAYDNGLRAGRVRAPVTNTEFAWVIERGSSLVSSPSYFSGVHWGMGLPQWSKNNLDAVRFASREHAQRIADSFPPVKSLIPPHRITEHGWVG